MRHLYMLLTAAGLFASSTFAVNVNDLDEIAERELLDEAETAYADVDASESESK